MAYIAMMLNIEGEGRNVGIFTSIREQQGERPKARFVFNEQRKQMNEGS